MAAWPGNSRAMGGSITVHVILGAGLLLVSTTLVGLAATPAEAATGCDAPDTTWVGPATEGGSVSWAEPTNWTAGVPTATSVVCIPSDIPGPEVTSADATADVIDARGATVTLWRELTVGTSFDVGVLVGEVGELIGPATTTVTDSIGGSMLTLLGSAVVELSPGAVVDGDLQVWDGSRLNVRGDAVLGNGATVDSFSEDPGLFTITNTGSLTLEAGDSNATVQGGFANHGEVTVAAGQGLMMLGAAPEDASPDQFSTGSFTGAPGAFFNVSGTELRDGARIDDATLVDHITVPAGNTATVASSSLVGFPDDPAPSIHGDGELVVTDGTVADARIGGSLTVTVPAGETLTMGGNEIVEDRVHLKVFGELAQIGDLFLQDETKLTLRGPEAFIGDLATLDNGPNGKLKLLGGADLAVAGPLRNEGNVRLSPGSRLDVGGKFHQLTTGALIVEVDSAGIGRVRAEGRRDLAGGLVVDREPSYTPPVDTILTFLTSNGRVDPHDAFDGVVSPKYGSRKLRVLYEPDRVRLWVDRVG